jgi:DNA-directed RNA polymerase alpha subunit
VLVAPQIEICDLGVGPRIGGALRRRGIYNVPQLALYTRAELASIQGVGEKALDTIEFALLVHGWLLQLPDGEEDS